MTIKKDQHGECLTLIIEGRLDTITAPQLEKELLASSKDIKELVLDFAKLDYLSSAGLRVILAAQKKMNSAKGHMTISNINDMVREVFKMTGFINILTIV